MLKIPIPDNFVMVKFGAIPGEVSASQIHEVPHPDVPAWARDFAALAELNQALWDGWKSWML